MGEQRALFRVADLVELARLLARLSSAVRWRRQMGCKVIVAAYVKINMTLSRTRILVE